MKASKFSAAQKAFILKQGAEGFLWRRSAGGPDACRRGRKDGGLAQILAQRPDLLAQIRWYCQQPS